VSAGRPESQTDVHALSRCGACLPLRNAWHAVRHGRQVPRPLGHACHREFPPGRGARPGSPDAAARRRRGRVWEPRPVRDQRRAYGGSDWSSTRVWSPAT